MCVLLKSIQTRSASRDALWALRDTEGMRDRFPFRSRKQTPRSLSISRQPPAAAGVDEPSVSLGER